MWTLEDESNLHEQLKDFGWYDSDWMDYEMIITTDPNPRPFKFVLEEDGRFGIEFTDGYEVKCTKCDWSGLDYERIKGIIEQYHEKIHILSGCPKCYNQTEYIKELI